MLKTLALAALISYVSAGPAAEADRVLYLPGMD